MTLLSIQLSLNNMNNAYTKFYILAKPFENNPILPLGYIIEEFQYKCLSLKARKHFLLCDGHKIRNKALREVCNSDRLPNLVYS